MAVLTTDQVKTQRASAVENALASVRMEGLKPSEQTIALFQRYVEGDLTSEDLDHAFSIYLDREYGPVCLSGTNILRNIRNVRDLDKPAELEAQATSFRMCQHEHKPLQGRFDTGHLKSHYHIFQDVCPWAGEFRNLRYWEVR